MASQPETNPRFTNHLAQEKSPYLAQHAHQPVDWYPWGEEAFSLARQQDKPLFVSIGYASCHWCHVMARESFDNLEIAQLMNGAFVNVAVDREELPEVDRLYMDFAQAMMSSGGGWPLNVLLTPELKPFFAVTYLPPKSKRGVVGMAQFVKQIRELWQSEERMQLASQADQLVEMLSTTMMATGTGLPDQEDLQNGLEMLFDAADPVYGGVKGELKFPFGYHALFLLGIASRMGESRALFYVELTLDMMVRGGIYDQIGGGFHRYSVDERWMVPHFEKMLTDNALLSRAYLEAWKYTKQPTYRSVVERTLRYVMRELALPEGGFGSAQDADTEGEEGTFYTWTRSQIEEALPPKDAELICRLYGVTHTGNFEGRSVLHLSLSLQEFADAFGIPLHEVEGVTRRAEERLFQARQKRTAPLRDDKIVSSFNGLMIDSLIRAASALGEQSWSDAAVKAAEFLKAHLWKEGRLLRRYCQGEARFAGSLEDYAFVIKGCLSLFEEGFGLQWLEWALEMCRVLQREFKAEGGAFYQTENGDSVLLRRFEFYDGDVPSGNAVHCENLLRLYQLTMEESYLAQAEDILQAVRQYVQTYASGAAYHLLCLHRALDQKAPSLVVALDEKGSLYSEIAMALSAHFSPHQAIVWKRAGDERMDALLPWVADKTPLHGQTTLYICRKDRCEPPLTQAETILAAIGTL